MTPRGGSAPRWPLLATAALAVSLAALAGCESDSPAGTERGATAGLRVLNGSRSTVSVLVDGSTRVATLAPGAVSPVLDVAQGGRSVELRPAGAASGAVAQATVSAADTTFIAALSAATGSGVVASVVADTGAVPAAGMAKLRAIHLAAGQPSIWAWRVQPDFPSPVTFQFPYPYGTTTPYVQSTPGTWQVLVTPASGSTPIGSDALNHVMARLSISVGANQARTVAILDSAGTVRIVAVDAP